MDASRYLLIPTLGMFCSLAFAQERGGPTLEHSAPFLGHRLVLSMQGATPGAPAALMQSPEAGEVVLPYGVLELDPDQVTVIATDEVNTEGRARFFIPLPKDAASAELECHYQILVGDAARPTSAALSEAVHLRVLGPRVYVGHGPYGLSIVSATDESVVVNVDVDTPGGASVPGTRGGAVFNRNYSRGAVMTGRDELLIFDPFFGEVIRRVSFEHATRELIVDARQEHVLVLERRSVGGGPTLNGRVHIIDLEAGDVDAVVELPHAVLNQWVAHRDGNAYIAENRGDYTIFVRRFGIEGREVLDAFEVGQTRFGQISGMTITHDTLFTTVSSGFEGEISRISLSSAPVAVDSTPVPGQANLRDLIPVLAARRVLFGRYFTGYGGADLHSAPIVGSDPVESIGMPGGARGLADAVVRGRSIWALSTELDADGEPDFLVYMEDVLEPGWVNIGGSNCAGSFAGIGSIRDRYVDQIVYGVHSCSIGAATSTLVFHDPVTNAESAVALDHRQSSLRTVPVPSRAPAGLDSAR